VSSSLMDWYGVSKCTSAVCSQCDTRAVQWPRSLLIAGGGDQDTDTAAAVDAAARLWCAHVIRT